VSFLRSAKEGIAMTWRVQCLILASVGFFAPLGRAPAEDAPEPDLKPLLRDVEKLVGRYYPKAQVTLKDRTIHFEFNTRKFMIHEPNLAGEWQNASEVVGPQKGGICGRLELCRGKYGAQLALPHRSDKRYFTSQLLAPYSEKWDRHLMVELMYPADVPKDFLKDFYRLVSEFDKHIRAGGR
jgi:hypothetical protein